MVNLVHELISIGGTLSRKEALIYQGKRLTYEALASEVERTRDAMLGLGRKVEPGVSQFTWSAPGGGDFIVAAAAAGGVFVPVNPLLKENQAGRRTRTLKGLNNQAAASC